MYNEERKMRFLEETRSSIGFGRSVFNTIAPYEQKEGKDLCELPIEILQPVANSNFGARTRTADSTIAFLRTYTTWCRGEGYPVGDGVYLLKTEMDDKVRRLMIASPKHLEAILNKAFNPVQAEMVDCLYRCYLWMVFSGLKDLEALDVKVSEVDFENMLIEHNGKSYELYREAVPAFRMACNATQFRYSNPNYSDDKQGNYRNRYPGELLMRGIRSEQIKIATVRGSIGKAFKECGIETTINKIHLSGLFYKAYEMERCGEEVSFDGIVEERLSQMDRTYHKNYTRNKVANAIKRDLFDDYGCWKAAFA